MRVGLIKIIFDSLVEFKIEDFDSSLKEALEKDLDPLEILDTLREAMEEVGARFEKGEYFLSELIMAGEMMKDAVKTLTPSMKGIEVPKKGKVVVGTIEGDLHDIGKDIVATLLFSEGFQVYDLGIDVPPSSYVEKAEEVGADIIGISALLSTTITKASNVVEALREKGMREKVKVIMGGAAVRKKHVDEFGVDAAVYDAVEGVKIIKTWMKE